VSIKDFVFAKEVRLGSYSDKVAPPPAALVATKRLKQDPRAEPRYGERIPYIVICGSPQSRLMDLVISPQLLLQNPKLRLNSQYYIHKQIIPSLERIFNLIGVDLKLWFNEMPRIRPNTLNIVKEKKVTIEDYYTGGHCNICDTLIKNGEILCQPCKNNKQFTGFILINKMKQTEQHYTHLVETCMQCTGSRNPNISCDSLDCVIYFERVKIETILNSQNSLLSKVLDEF